MLVVALPRPNEIVGINEPFIVSGITDLTGLQEVTIQVDAGSVTRASIIPVTHPVVIPPRAIFTGWGMVAALGPHTVIVKAHYWEKPTTTVTVDIKALGEPE